MSRSVWTRVKTYRVALYPGDGIGTEVVDATLAVLEAVARKLGGFGLTYERFDWGMALYDRHGKVVPDDFLATLRGFDAIRSDLTGGVTGSLGLNPSANLNPERTFPSFFEPVHGSAPDIAGQGIANPTGAILSGAIRLEWLGEAAAAASVRAAMERALGARNLTPDVGGTQTTAQITAAVVREIR